VSSLTDKIIEYLRQHPNARPREIADYLGVSPRVVRAVLTRLRNKGIVIRSEKGYILRRPGAAEAGPESHIEAVGSEVKAHEAGEAAAAGSIAATITATTAGAAQAQQTAQPVQQIQAPSADLASLESRISRIESEVAEIRRALDDIRGLIQTYRESSGEGIQQSAVIEAVLRLAEAVEALALAVQRISYGDTAVADLVDEALEKVGSATSNIRAKKPSKS